MQRKKSSNWNPRFVSSRILPLLIIAATVALIYARSLRYPYFIFDDVFHIFGNPRLHPASWANVAWFWNHSLIPVTYSVWSGLAAVFGTQSPAPYRALLITLHAANGFLVFLCLTKLVPAIEPKGSAARTEIRVACLLGALVFVTHPSQVEAVAWISSTKDVLSGFFAFLALNSHLARANRAVPEELDRPAWRRDLYMLLSVLSKFSGVMLLPIFAWLDHFLYARPSRLILRDYGAVAVLACVGYLALTKNLPNEPLVPVLSVPWRSVVALDSLSSFLSILLLPINCHFDYSHTPASVVRGLRQFELSAFSQIAVGIITVIIGISSRRLARFRLLHFSLGFSILALVPSLGFIPFIHQAISTIADRYLYLAVFGLSLMVAGAYVKVQSKPVILALLSCGFLIYGTLSTIYCQYWQDSIVLLSYSVEKNPTAYTSHIALGSAYRASGHEQEARHELGIAEWLRSEGQAP